MQFFTLFLIAWTPSHSHHFRHHRVALLHGLDKHLDVTKFNSIQVQSFASPSLLDNTTVIVDTVIQKMQCKSDTDIDSDALAAEIPILNQSKTVSIRINGKKCELFLWSDCNLKSKWIELNCSSVQKLYRKKVVYVARYIFISYKLDEQI